MAEQAANQPHKLGALPGLRCGCTGTSLSTVIGNKDRRNEDKMWACS